METERARTNAPPRHIRHFRFCLRFLSKRHETTEGAGNLSPTCVSVPFGGIPLARPLLTPLFRESVAVSAASFAAARKATVANCIGYV